MKTIEEKFDESTRRSMDYDKTTTGPWDSEYDKKQWLDEATGLPCLVVRNQMGALCGYVGVPKGHPWYGKNYDAIDDPWPEVHGGLTYSGPCNRKICHVVEDGESEDVWWLGFDCAHSGDVIPAMSALPGMEQFRSLHSGDVYRGVAYVENEVRGLARQARDA